MVETDTGDSQMSSAGCGCCEPEHKTTEDVVRELEDRRARLDQRLRRLELVGAR